MSDTDPSGAATAAAETASAPSTPPPATLPGTFGNSRGSGLARGKRPASPAPQPAAAASTPEYKPTAVSILTAPTEYRNPFAPPAPGAPPAEAEASSAPAPGSAPVPTPIAPEIPAELASATPASPVPESLPPADAAKPAEPAAAEPRAELKILPPETPRRIEQSWASESFPNVASQPGAGPGRPPAPESGEQRPRHEDRRGDRPYYRSDRERRDDRWSESRQPRSGSTPQARDFDRSRPQGGPAARRSPGRPAACSAGSRNSLAARRRKRRSLKPSPARPPDGNSAPTGPTGTAAAAGAATGNFTATSAVRAKVREATSAITAANSASTATTGTTIAAEEVTRTRDVPRAGLPAPAVDSHRLFRHRMNQGRPSTAVGAFSFSPSGAPPAGHSGSAATDRRPDFPAKGQILL